MTAQFELNETAIGDSFLPRHKDFRNFGIILQNFKKNGTDYLLISMFQQIICSVSSRRIVYCFEGDQGLTPDCWAALAMCVLPVPCDHPLRLSLVRP